MTESIREPEKVPVQEPPQPSAPEKKTPPRRPDPVNPGRG